MALIPFDQLTTRWQEGAQLAVTRLREGRAREDALRAQLTAAGLPDDQVPPAPQDDAAVEQFFADMAALVPVEPDAPGGDVLPDTDALPEVPGDTTTPTEPTPTEPPAPTA